MNWTTLLKRGAVYGAVTVAMFAFGVDEKLEQYLK